jgi:hypothetical protein
MSGLASKRFTKQVRLGGGLREACRRFVLVYAVIVAWALEARRKNSNRADTTGTCPLGGNHQRPGRLLTADQLRALQTPDAPTRLITAWRRRPFRSTSPSRRRWRCSARMPMRSWWRSPGLSGPMPARKSMASSTASTNMHPPASRAAEDGAHQVSAQAGALCARRLLQSSAAIARESPWRH